MKVRDYGSQSFWRGTVFTVLILQMLSDWVGKEACFRYLHKHWEDTQWGLWFAIAAAVLIWQVVAEERAVDTMVMR